MTSHSQAAVNVSFAQNGDDVVATWTGLIDLGDWDSDRNAGNASRSDDGIFYGIDGIIEFYDGGTAASIPGFSGNIDEFTGSAGFLDVEFAIGGLDDNKAPSSSIYNFDTLGVTQTFKDDTLADIGADSFDNTLAWTSSAGGEIRFTTVPEPSSTALIISLGALALAVRRRR